MNILKGIKDYRLLNYNMYRMTPVELKAYQLTEIQRLVNYAKEKSPFYSTLYHKLWDKNNLDHAGQIDQNMPGCFDINSFFNLPIINKQIMMDHFDELNTCGIKKTEALAFALNQEFSGDYSGYFKQDYVVGLSSGTSGNKGVFITPREMTERLPFVFLARGGIPLAYLPFRILFLLRVFSQGFSDINGPFIKLSYKSTMTAPDELIKMINGQKINIIMAPPSMLRILIAQASKIHHRIKIIVSYAEVLEKEEKARIEKAFNCSVHEIYQASEGQIGSTCRCGKLHINEDLVFVELYDASGKAVEEPGIIADKMLVTNLVNWAQPLIRYEMNDMIILGDKCACGSAFRVIEKVLGRHDDVLYLQTTQGDIKPVFPDLFARWIITTDDRIREFKVVQKTIEALEIVIDLDTDLKGMSDVGEIPARLNDSEEILKKLSNRIEMELAGFDIRCKTSITFRKISLPAKMSKYKRFESLPK